MGFKEFEIIDFGHLETKKKKKQIGVFDMINP